MSYQFEAERDATLGVKNLGVALEGKFPSWFDNMPKPDEEGRPPLPDKISEAKESRVVVIGDSDLPGMIMQYTQSQRNLDFIMQAAEWLGADDDIVSIRSRRGVAGRLDRIPDPVKRVGAMQRARIVNVVVVPLIIIVAGVLRLTKRRKEVAK
jgi:ABC-type uncharacterized transport system involved in gliding motility auxiliary subunit